MATTQRTERVYCRNLRCRSKLAVPTDNHHKAFCSPYCYNQFYNRKCLVCEKDLPREGRRRTLCRSHKCRLDYRKFRPAYVLSDSVRLPPDPNGNSDSKSPYKPGTFFRLNLSGDGPLNILGGGSWRWPKAGQLDGKTLATIVHSEIGGEVAKPLDSEWLDSPPADGDAE